MPIFLDTTKKRKYYFRAGVSVVIALVIGCATLFFIGLSVSAVSVQPISYEDAIERSHYYYGAATKNKIALTIDDGPNPALAEDFYDTLSQYNAPATFFYEGARSLVRPDLLRKGSEMGFSIQNHSFTHGPQVHSSDTRFAFEVDTTGYIIELATGKKPIFYRPPYLLGIGVDPSVNPYIPLAEDVLWSLERGYIPNGTDIDPKDWQVTSPEELLQNLSAALAENKNGHTVLLHETKVTLEALPSIISYLRAEGYEIVPLEELITPPTSITLTETLALGSTDANTGGQVSDLQWFLYKEGFLDPYGLTGVYDAATRDAVENLQIQRNIIDQNNPDLAALGTVGAATRAAIASMSAEQSAAKQGVSTASKNPLTAAMAGVVPPLRYIYVNMFPFTSAFLVVMIFFALILVVARALALIFLLALARKHDKPVLTRRYSELPGVSVLIPAFNEENNIAATVESVIRSSYPKKEIIVIDDGSKDGTAAEVRSVIDAHPNDSIQLVQLENGGKARALNIGIEHAHNSIISVLDADAVMDAEALSHYVKHFDDPSVGAVAGRVRTTSSSNWLDLFQKLEYAVGQNIDKRAFSVIGAVGVVPGPAGAWRKKNLLELGGFKTDTLAEDQDMTMTLLRAGKKIVYEPDAISYTETPHSITNFLKQRFRWVYGTMQCFWKHKRAMIERPDSVMSLVVLPNVFIYNILLPLTYPFADSAFLFGIFFGGWDTLILPFIIFTAFDLAYAMWGVWREPQGWRLMLAVPFQRMIYRPLLYYTVYKSAVRVLEGTGSSWNAFKKVGETRRFYLSALRAGPQLATPAGIPSPIPLSAILGAEEKREEEAHSQVMPEDVTALSIIPRQDQSVSET